MTELRINDDLVRWTVDRRPATADEALRALETRPLVLLMHGFGSFEGDLISLAAELPDGIVCASPRAPLTLPPPTVNGYAWWEIVFRADGTVVRSDPPAFEDSDAHTATLAILAWLDALDARVAGGLRTVVPLGFSQGGCMVTSLLRMQPTRFPCGVNCSGFVAPGSYAGDPELAAIRPPLFWGRDPADPIIEAERIDATAVWSAAHTAIEAHIYHGIGHGIGREEIADISAFIERHLAEAEH
uniref:Lipase/esterase n=1 Tax=uncultured sludge bacterium TaxID=641485 RepID=E0WCJ6_9BACT|nr:lipase/esterase [uncultured sludge bacterium]